MPKPRFIHLNALSMNQGMAEMAQRNEIISEVTSAMAAQLLVMDLQRFHAAAGLASPSVALKHLSLKMPVGISVQSPARLFRPCPVHDAPWFSCSRKASLCASGRNLKKRETECKSNCGFPLSRFAPARKSAQIISRQ